MSKTITTEKFARYLGEHENMSADEKIARARHLMFLHRDGLKYGKTIDRSHIKQAFKSWKFIGAVGKSILNLVTL